MADEPITIRRISIENFRGFRSEQTLDLAASATIVSGSNGKGKTSFFDAVQWLLLGSLARLATLATRRSGDYIVNRFADPGDVAKVSAELELNGHTVMLTRAGDHREAPLQWSAGDQELRGTQAEDALCKALLADPEMSLEGTVLTSGLLQQDVVRAVLEDEPKNRYRHMSALLGLREIAGFEDAAKRAADEQGKGAKRARDEHAAAEQKLRSGEADLARLEQRLADEPEIARARADLGSRLAVGAPAFQFAELPSQAADAVFLSQLARRVRGTANELLAEDSRLRDAEVDRPDVTEKQLAEVIARHDKAEEASSEAHQAVEEARETHRRAEVRAGELAELASRAIPMLGDRCPVCRQTIDAQDVERHLRELIEAEGEDLPALATATAEAEQQLAAQEEALKALRAERAELDSLVREAAAGRTARRSWHQDCEQFASEIPSLRPDAARAIRDGSTEALAELRDSAEELSLLADELAALLGTAGLSEVVERQRVVVEARREAVTALSEQAARASQQAEETKTLAGAATRAIAAVTRDRFASLQPLVDNIFARLAPHPAFTSLGFEMTVSYRSGVADPFVKDPESGVTGDPLLVFSSSQANVAALTYFLALNWAAGTKALPFLLLDDPLQSMDDVNALGFSDLCRHVRSGRQLVVSTHEARLASLLERKLTPRSPEGRTRVLRFVGWDRSGPTIEQTDIEPESVGYLLHAA